MASEISGQVDLESMLEGEEDGEDSDADSDEPANLNKLLEEFRVQWQQELRQSGNSSPDASDSNSNSGLNVFDTNKNRVLRQPSLVEEQARQLFVQGIKAERKGNLSLAVQFYRHAIQMVPDIENKIDYRQLLPRRDRQESESSVDSSYADDEHHLNDEEALVQRFQRLQTFNENAICQPCWQQRSTHISVLPIELLMYIFKWVVSNELDLRSLEQLAMVCRGFYLCARDDELWKLSCNKVWGMNCGSKKLYGSWRSMYIDRPHLCFNGVYVSRSSYVRQGVSNVDVFYTTWQVVEYYRYVRFFPNGMVLVHTSPEDPVSTVAKLKEQHGRHQGMLKGYYRMTGNKVTAVMKRVKTEYRNANIYRYKRQRQPANQNEVEQKFHIEFDLCNAGKKKCAQLIWTEYKVHTIHRSGEETIANFELNNKNYPPLYFSRVKSYTAYSTSPLK